ncbi:MAG TPA: hypothetical protein DDW52_12445 [Planctomycetaceae bacterium]|nr:hypothetical protein [Planctomycetaceae bacterium]
MSNAKDNPRTDRPNLEQKRKLAKELRRAVKNLDSSNAARFTWNHPRFRGKSGRDVVREGVSLSDAQHVIARESGFESWPKLKKYIDLLDAEPDGPVAVFEDAVRAIIRGDAGQLQALLRSHPSLATQRSHRRHQCVLPHYIAANGVEDEHQIIPPNAPEIARILFDAGADQVVDATAGMYGGGSGSTPLISLVSSVHPNEAGVQEELVRVFCDAGASVNGLDNDCMPLSTALGFRYPEAAKVLADCGARIDNLPTAAALGRVDLVEAFLDVSGGLESQECHFPNPNHRPFPKSTAPHPAQTLQQAVVFACMCGHASLAKRLLDLGVDVNGGPRCGITALHEACYSGQAEASHLLLEHGADPTLRDDMWRSTAIGWANAGGRRSLVRWLLDTCDVDIRDAVELWQPAIVRRILKSAPPSLRSRAGLGDVLRLASMRGDVEMVELLLEFGADPAQQCEDGHTAIVYAEKFGNQQVLDLLNKAKDARKGE